MNDTNALLRRGILLEYITLGWNVVGAAIVIFAAIIARSVALAGFGLDSLVEICASTVVIWQLRGIHDKREQRALRLISIAFFALAAYILAQSEPSSPTKFSRPKRESHSWTLILPARFFSVSCSTLFLAGGGQTRSLV